MIKISVKEVTKKYADHTALDRMCIDIPDGHLPLHFCEDFAHRG